MKNNKIFLGTVEVAGMMTFLENAYKELGYTVTTCCSNYDSTFYSRKYDIEIRSIFLPLFIRKITGYRLFHYINEFIYSINRWKVYIKQRNRHDIFIFMWDGFFRNSTRDYAYLQKKGKKVITIFLGSDVRHIDAFKQQYNIDVSKWDEWFKKRSINQPLFRIRKAELYSNIIFSIPDQMGLAIRAYYNIYIPFDIKNYTQVYNDREIPKLIHIPSRIGIKGTEYILKAINQLKQEGYKFEFEFLTGVPNDFVINKLKDADVLVDEAFLPGPGTLSLEGIACGCVIVTKHELNGTYRNVITYIDTEKIYEPLKKVITDKAYRIQKSREALEVVKEVNNPETVANRILSLSLDNTSKYDHHPTFYISEFIIGVNKISKRNKKLTLEVLKKYGSNYKDKYSTLKNQNKI